MYNDIQQYWSELSVAMQAMPFGLLTHMTEILLACYQRGGTIFLFGNGGSAATASHFACDLAKGTRTRGIPALRVVSLNDNAALLTAWANDTSYTRIFAEQLAALVRPGDVVIMISTSGNSLNVLEASHVARQKGAITIALTGQNGGQLAQIVDLVVPVPSEIIEQVEDAHLIIAHSVCVHLRTRLNTTAALLEVEQNVLQSTRPVVTDLSGML